ncbi:MAG: spore cortex biosynthesis protein YabQ [Clostridia bacterium]|nr:spore cortex biosynthesis protein YabQ [Clostridia bacterium]
MTNTVYTLIAFFITGICISIIFDIFRISRKEFKTANIIIYLEDILFWILSGAGILFTIFNFTNR